MKYAVDRIVEDIVVLEDIESGKIIEVNKKELPSDIHEGSIVVNENDRLIADITEEEQRRESLRERLERLKRLKDND